MKTKTVKCRKHHQCSVCEEDINPGDLAKVEEHREPRYQSFNDDKLGNFETEKQIGIQYSRYYLHADHSEEDCPECNHRTGWKASYAHGGLEYWECSDCGHTATYP